MLKRWETKEKVKKLNRYSKHRINKGRRIEIKLKKKREKMDTYSWKKLLKNFKIVVAVSIIYYKEKNI